jgi:rod shape determining protein RodA
MPSEFLRSLPGDPAALSMRAGIFRRLRIDLPLLVLLLMLAGFGLIVLYSASGQNLSRVLRQCAYLGVAFLALLTVAQFSMKTVRALVPLLFVAGIVLLALVPFFGVEVNGAQRWLNIFGLLRFQPSEIMKVAVPLGVAAFLAQTSLPPKPLDLLLALLILAVPCGLTVIQPDLGTSLLIGISGLLVIWLAGLRWRVILVGLMTVGAAAWPIWQYFLQDYQRQRILTLFNPDSDRLGAGWNIIQSKTAIGSGGLTGKGWLNGTQSQLDFLPESHTDFIIAVLAEEFGLLGVMLLLTLYALIVLRGAMISLSAKNVFSRLVAGSITFIFLVYVIVNMGMVSGMLPVVGVPLPLVSYGGTAMITMIASFGFLMAVNAEAQS